MAISSTVFNDIPAALRIPGWFIEFDNRLAGRAVFNGKLLVLGQMLASGSTAPLMPVRVTRADQADELFGRGSMLAEQLRAIKSVDLYTEVWALPLLDDSQAQKAKGSILVTSGPTETRPLALYIAGYRIWCEMTAGATKDDTAQAIVDAIAADDRVPVTAAIDQTEAAKVVLTCRWGGETGNSISLDDCLKGEERTKGLAVTYVAPTGGAVNPDLIPAVAGMGDEWWNWLCLPYTDASSLEVIETELASRYGPMRQKGGRAFAAYMGNHSETGTIGRSRNTPHVAMMGMGEAFSAPWIWAATLSIVAGKALGIDPARPMRGLALPGLIGPREAKRWTDPERNLLLYDGISTYTVATDGAVLIERVITMYQRNSTGVEDDSYLDINTPETLERIRFDTVSLFARKYPRHKLADDADRLMYDPSQPVMTPKVAKAELLGLYKDTFMRDRAWVRDYAGYKGSLQASIDPDNPNRLNVIDSPMLIGQYLTHAQQTQFRR